ncbi:MAG: (p)ppGpp synthase/HD superfamily hydrolase [Halioglobus sp.]|jgi:(p)ppGpp synthase/HD superfamily hydrolase
MWSIDKAQRAWYLASQLHYGQKYGGKTKGKDLEYLSHIGSVTFEIIGVSFIEPDIDIDLAVTCAVLHDSFEDTTLSYNEVAATFGLAVAEGVKALSKKEFYHDKRDMMIDSLKRIKQQPKEIAMVKMADRICNLYSSPYYWGRERRLAYQKESILILQELEQASDYLSLRLKQKIRNYDVYILE